MFRIIRDQNRYKQTHYKNSSDFEPREIYITIYYGANVHNI